jgi:phospholipid N-methyltransferase
MSVHEGHIVAAVFEVHSLPTIVAGVYGNSDSSDRSSLTVLEELKSFLRELSHVYQTQRIILAGDFNVALEETDSNSGATHKPLTSSLLKEILLDHQLVDVGQKARNTQHTWYRKDSSGQSSRLDYIFSSIPLRQAKLSSTLSIFDHVYLEATLNPSRQAKQMTMKDFILGSDEFIIQSHELYRTKWHRHLLHRHKTTLPLLERELWTTIFKLMRKEQASLLFTFSMRLYNNFNIFMIR